MKRAVFASLMFVMLCATEASAQKLSNLLLEFETATKWAAFNEEWRGRRDSWLDEVRQAGSNIPKLIVLLREFEQNVQYEAQSDSWRQDRGGWVSELETCAKRECFRSLLLKFEASITWEAVDTGWRTRRDGWIQDVMRGK